MEHRFGFCQNSDHSLNSAHDSFRGIYFWNILMKLKLRQRNSKIKKGKEKDKTKTTTQRENKFESKGKITIIR